MVKIFMREYSSSFKETNVLQPVGSKQVTRRLPPTTPVMGTRLYQYQKTQEPVPPVLKTTVTRREQ